MRVAILIDEFSAVPTELRLLWNRWEARDQLIPWDLARDYFRAPDDCQRVEIIEVME